jgi:hypothetical protein
MGKMCKHTEYNNIILFAVLLESVGIMAFVAVQNQKTVYTRFPTFGVFVKMF